MNNKQARELRKMAKPTVTELAEAPFLKWVTHSEEEIKAMTNQTTNPEEGTPVKRTIIKDEDGIITGYSENIGKFQYLDIQDQYPFETVKFIKEGATGTVHTLVEGAHIEELIEDLTDHELLITKQVNVEVGFSAVTYIFSNEEGDVFSIRTIEEDMRKAEIVEEAEAIEEA